MLVAGLNFFRVQRAANDAARFKGDINFIAHYHWGIHPNVIVCDLWDVGWSASQTEVLGGFLRFAENMKKREFGEVLLAYRGDAKFRLDGAEYQRIGRKLAHQNPVFVVRTFPEKLKTPEGDRAFSTWQGGLVGVLGRQIEDLNELSRQWYLDEMPGS